MPKPGIIRVPVPLTAQEHEALKDKAAGLDRSLAWVMKQAIREYIGIDRTGARHGKRAT